MGGIFSRFKNIMKANYNGILDKAEKPDKMIDQYLRNLEEDLSEVKGSTAEVLAHEKQVRRQIEKSERSVKEWNGYAAQAAGKGNDDDARLFLQKQIAEENRLAGFRDSLKVAEENSLKMRQMHDKLVSDMEVLRSQRDELKARYTVAKTKQDLAGKASGLNSRVNNDMAGFGRMSDKITRMMDEADALISLESETKDVEDAKARYTKPAVDEDIENRLKALKQLKAG